MKKRIFVNIHYLEIGGAERSLLSLLSVLDPEKVDIDLFVNQHTGEFMSFIPEYVNLLPEIPEYTCIEKPILSVLKKGYINIALRRIWGKWKHYCYIKRGRQNIKEPYTSLFQYVADAVDECLPSLEHFGLYDLAISFLQPHNIVLHKVRAKKKICWIHTDYSTVHVNKEKELRIWQGFDNIVSISRDCTLAFLKTFPELEDKIILIENILSPAFVRNQAILENVSLEMPSLHEGAFSILSIGRFHPAKNFECIPHICSELEKLGFDFKWYVVGYGSDRVIQEELDKYKMRHRMILLGKKINPYPYIKACDIYVQPSRYEGKSVTVGEAQILYKPILITNYPTAKSQVKDGFDGVIVDQDDLAIVNGLTHLMNDKYLRNRIVNYLKTHDYGNEKEVDKIYEILSTID